MNKKVSQKIEKHINEWNNVNKYVNKYIHINSIVLIYFTFTFNA